MVRSAPPRYPNSWPVSLNARLRRQRRGQRTPEPVTREAYTYTQLSRGDLIRYIVLAAGRGDDLLVCSLHQSHVDAASFEAISYVWGTPDREQTIICDGKTLKITPNLRDALRRVRLSDRSRSLWADSICINQDDPGERGHQVGLMSRIYGRAEQVLVCLGQAPDGSATDAASLVEEVCSRVLATYLKIDLSPESFPDPPADDSMARDPRWNSLAHLLAADWFKRGWVVQECGLARSAVLLWGSSEIPWAAFMRTWLYAERLYKSAGPAAILQPSWESIFFGLNNMHSAAFAATYRPESAAWFPAGHRTVATSPLQMIRDSGGLALADERDRIFAFQSLARRITDTRFRPETPDYGMSLWEVYLGFAKRYVLDTGDLALLNFVHHDEWTIDEAPVSWCPQWNVVVYEGGLVTELGNVMSPSLPPRLLGDVLCVRGVVFDVVSTTSDELSKQTRIEDIGRIWNSWKTIGSPSEPAGKDSGLGAFANCLAAGDPLAPLMPVRWERHFAAYVRELARVTACNDRELPEGLASDDGGDIAWAHFQVAHMIDKRRLVVTDRGYYGLAPGLSRGGDVVAVVDGALTPLILREKSPGHYRVVGEVYVTSKAVCYSESETREYKLLGGAGAQDWTEWGGEVQDIFLV